MIQTYFIERSTGTSTDTLLAIGFAALLGQLNFFQYGHQNEVRLLDRGPCYQVKALPVSPHLLKDDDLLALLLVRPLDSSRQREKQARKAPVAHHIDGYPYDEKIEESRAYRARIKELPPEFQTPEARLKRAPELAALLGDMPETDTYLNNYQAINQMKIATTFNDLALRWDRLTPAQKRLHIDLLVQLFSQPRNDVATATKNWQQLAQRESIQGNALSSTLQIINPTTGKGANRAKANGLAIGNQEQFWLLELLKFRGFMEGAVPLMVKDSDDRKTYIIQPTEIKMTLLQDIVKHFRAVFWPSTAVKLDILASLRFAQVLVESYRQQFRKHPLAEPWMVPEITRLVAGFDVTFYKFLGSAHATMNISTLGLPDWLPPLDTIEHADAAVELLDEHVYLVQHIRTSKGDEGSEEYTLLRLYRDFLSAHDLHPFWEFTTVYCGYVMSAREKKRFVPQLTIRGLEKLIMSNASERETLKPIVEKEGFQHIADAIRRSTVYAQYRRSQQNDRTYDTRYGLAQELRRKAHRPKEFLDALGTFLQQYSEETAREEEKLAKHLQNKVLTKEDRQQHHLRRNISEQDLIDIIELVDRHGSSLICSLLLAFGYAQRSDLKKAE